MRISRELLGQEYVTYYPVCLFQEFVNIPESEGWIEGRSSIVALQELIQGRREICHSCNIEKVRSRAC
jgi:hypothetical protein